jgi:S1-C subfamily serine protease
VNVLDAVIVVIALAAGIGGWRFGFVARLLAWAGVAVGLMVGIRFVPGVVTAFGGTAADDRVTVAVLFLVLVATLGQGVGLAIGALLHRARPEVRGLPVWDRAAGAALGVTGVLALLWMTIPSLATAQGWPARVARGSAIVGAIDDVAPEQPSTFASWGTRISEAPYPNAIGPLDEPPNPGAPPETGLSDEVDARVRDSVVKIHGQACSQIQEGTGWVARPGFVVTNAHVVAGEDETVVDSATQRGLEARVVAFAPRRDIAVLYVPGLDAPPLETVPGRQGIEGAVYGHPEGGALRAAPARIAQVFLARGSDIYRVQNEVERRVYILAAKLQPGDSGGPLVDRGGDVAGVAFAIDPANPDSTAYALALEEFEDLVDAAGTTPVDTGDCLVG